MEEKQQLLEGRERKMDGNSEYVWEVFAGSSHTDSMEAVPEDPGSQEWPGTPETHEGQGGKGSSSHTSVNHEDARGDTEARQIRENGSEHAGDREQVRECPDARCSSHAWSTSTSPGFHFLPQIAGMRPPQDIRTP